MILTAIRDIVFEHSERLSPLKKEAQAEAVVILSTMKRSVKNMLMVSVSGTAVSASMKKSLAVAAASVPTKSVGISAGARRRRRHTLIRHRPDDF